MPSTETTYPTVPMQQALSENLITLLCHSDEYGKLIAAQVEPHEFENEVHRHIAAKALEFWQQHNEPPRTAHTGDLIADITEDEDNRRAPVYQAVVRNMLILFDQGLNGRYVLDQLSAWKRMQSLKRVMLEGVDLLDARQQYALDEVEDKFREILRTKPIHIEPGLKLSDYDKVATYLESRELEFDTGIAPFDERGIVPARQTVYLLMAGPGRGKSWFAVSVGKRAVRNRKKVFHGSLELREEPIMARYYQALFGITRWKAKHGVLAVHLKVDPETKKFEAIEEKTITPKWHLASPIVRQELENYLTHVFGTRIQKDLIVKKFPSRRTSVKDIRAHLEGLDLKHSFNPDMIILENLGLLKASHEKRNLDIGLEFEEFRNLCEDFNAAGVVLHQTNRQGAGAREVREGHTADDFSIMGTTDIAVTFSATRDERQRQLARLFCTKAREASDQIGVLITQNYAVGQFCIDAIPLSDDYFKYIDRLNQRDEEQQEESDDSRSGVSEG